MAGRAFGTEGETRAATWIASAFDRLGLPPPPGRGRFQPVRGEVEGKQVSSAGNVLAWLDAGAPDTLVIGAHHDHIGDGGPLSRDLFQRALHPGADDNASGVALLLAVADRLAHSASPLPVNVLFVTFAGEETGLYGSGTFVRAPPVPLGSVRAFMNFDMVGRLDERAPVLAVEGTSEYPALAPLVDAIPARGLTVRQAPNIFPGGSNHVSFDAQSVPVLALSTGVTADYHRASDGPDRINHAGPEAIAAWTLELVEAVARAPRSARFAPPASPH